MESTRLNKIGRLIQKELGDIFQKQTQGMPGILISVKCGTRQPRPGRCQSIPEHLPFRKRERVTGIDPCKYQSDPFRFG